MRVVIPGSALALSFLLGCGASPPRTTTPDPARSVDMDEIRITARPNDAGDYDFDAYDAETLFMRAVDRMNRRDCAGAVVLYDRVASEFPTGRYLSASLYNAGLCLTETQELDGAALRFSRLIEQAPDSPDVKDASFQLVRVLIELERWTGALAIADTLSARQDLRAEERIEALARRAQSLLGLGRLDDAERQAREALTYARTRPEEDPIRDEFFVAASNFVLADAIRARQETLAFPESDTAAQRAVLERRAELLLQAQTEYFNTIRLTNPHWAAAAGYRIGAMYDGLWNAVMTAPVPARPDLDDADRAVFAEEYRRELSNMIKPLLRHAVRYWDLTLMMVERTGVRTEWADRARRDLERVRQVLVEQGPGAGGLPPASGTQPSVAPPSGTNPTP